MVPDSLHNPYELRPVVGAALVNDGLEPRVAVERVRDACEHTSVVNVLQAACNLGRVQQLIGNRRTTIHKVHCHCPCAPSHHLKVLGVCVCNGSRRDVCCGGRLLQPPHQPVDLVDPLERAAVHSCIQCGDALTFLQSVPVSGRCCREELEHAGRAQHGALPSLKDTDVLVVLDVPRDSKDDRPSHLLRGDPQQRPLVHEGVEAHIGHSNVDIIDLAWGPERGSGHLVDRGCPERHARGGTPLQINPKQVDAGRVGL